VLGNILLGYKDRSKILAQEEQIDVEGDCHCEARVITLVQVECFYRLVVEKSPSKGRHG
jgi:hypothetical protein